VRIFCESFSLGSLLNQSQTYQGNPCGIYSDLSFLSRSGVIQTLWPVSNNPFLVRITSSSIRASVLDTGSIISNFNLSQVHVLFCNLCSCLRVYLRSCFDLVSLFLHSCSCFVLFQNSVPKSCFKILFQLYFKFCFEFCLGTILLAGWIWGLGFRRSNFLIAYWTNRLNYPRRIWKESIIKKVAESLRKIWKKKSGCLIFECIFEAIKGIFFGKNRGPNLLWKLLRDSSLNSEHFDI